MFEPEEFIGERWHRLVGAAASWPSHPGAAVGLDEMRGELAVLFRGLGGPGGVAIAGASAAASGHRLGWRQRLGLAEERLERAQRRPDALLLPLRLDLLPTAELNRGLYRWLAAFFAYAAEQDTSDTEYASDIARLRHAHATTAAVLAACPGLRATHERLCAALLAARPRRRLPAPEAEMEAAVLALLGGAPAAGPVWQAVLGGATPPAPRRYRPFLPVPLWGEVPPGVTVPRPPAAESDSPGGGEDARDGRRRRAARREAEQSERDDPLVLNRFEKILSLAGMMNISRATDDDEDPDAKKAADDLDEITLGQNKGRPATRLKLDLDLAPEAADTARLAAALTYPEWDWRRRAYLPDHCRVLAAPAAEEGEDWRPDAETKRRIERVRRQFEALRPKHEILRGQVDGDELDLEALVRVQADLRAQGQGSDRVHLAGRRQARDLAAALLVDVSLSTDAWIDGRRVLDVEKQALAVLAHGLAACGDDHAIFTFTSRRRDWVRVDTVKDFDEPFGPRVDRRIAALKPGYYTRIGAAVRHATARLAERPHRHRLLIVLTDGKPNDIDHYEGRHGIEDTRRAVQEARRAGLAVFGVTIDREAQDYFPTLFGRGGYAIVGDVAALPTALPAIYRQLSA